MPYVTPSIAYNHTTEKSAYAIYMKPYYMAGLLDIAKYYQWERAAYIYDSDTGRFFLQIHSSV